VSRYDETKLGAATDGLAGGRYDWLVFTSANAVEILFEFLCAKSLDARSVRAKVAAIGPGTAEALRGRGIVADLLPAAESYTADGLLGAFEQIDVSGQRVLLPRAEGGRDVLVDGLRKRGATVDEITLYVAAPPKDADAEGLRRLRAGEIDMTTFASSSAVRNLVDLLGGDIESLRRCRIACIGPITAQTVEELLGRAPDVIATEHTIAGLVAALAERYTV
jgi:uroporphyrinogen III methyltransferase/synthase